MFIRSPRVPLWSNYEGQWNSSSNTLVSKHPHIQVILSQLLTRCEWRAASQRQHDEERGCRVVLSSRVYSGSVAPAAETVGAACGSCGGARVGDCHQGVSGDLSLERSISRGLGAARRSARYSHRRLSSRNFHST
ncbi:unnamed protein product [Dracunculus medinensis]|uniref:Uncharacterized protein n=1 Tax=Dracunculus medinensis TaxID=318479 RepID=A0A0N4UNA3_DRAME|nr:unnamed protein product [Dracunculus medinensis]